MRRVVETTNHPAITLDYYVRNRRIVGTREAEPLRTTRDIHYLTDHPTVDNSYNKLVGMRFSDPPDSATHAILKLVGWLATGNDIPPLLGVHHLHQRIAVDNAATKFPTFPVAEKYFAEVCLNDWLLAKLSQQRRGGLLRPLQRRYIHRGDLFTGVDQALSREDRLLFAFRSQGRVSVAVDEPKRLAFDVRR